MNQKTLIILSFLFSLGAYAQQYVRYSTENISYHNPAFYALGDSKIISLNARTQWHEVPGAPQTQSLSFVSPLREGSRWGLGVDFTNDRVGPVSQQHLYVDLGYRINLGQSTTLRSGFKVGARNNSISTSKFNSEEYDPEIYTIDGGFRPALGFGFLLGNDRRWYASFSMPNFLESGDDQNIEYLEEATLLFGGGYLFHFNDRVSRLRPSVMGRYLDGAPLSIDVGLDYINTNGYSLGVSYNTDESVAFRIALYVATSISIGYNYEASITNKARASTGTHGVSLRYEFIKDKAKKITNTIFF